MHAVPNRKYRIGRSKTGLGLYATKPFRKREYIVTYRGRRLPQCGGRPARGARLALHVRDQHALDHRRLQALERGALRQPFVPAERRGRSSAAARSSSIARAAGSNRTKRSRSTTARITSRPSSARAAAAASNAWSGAPSAQAKRRAKIKRAERKRARRRESARIGAAALGQLRSRPKTEALAPVRIRGRAWRPPNTARRRAPG